MENSTISNAIKIINEANTTIEYIVLKILIPLKMKKLQLMKQTVISQINYQVSYHSKQQFERSKEIFIKLFKFYRLMLIKMLEQKS